MLCSACSPAAAASQQHSLLVLPMRRTARCTCVRSRTNAMSCGRRAAKHAAETRRPVSNLRCRSPTPPVAWRRSDVLRVQRAHSYRLCAALFFPIFSSLGQNPTEAELQVRAHFTSPRFVLHAMTSLSHAFAWRGARWARLKRVCDAWAGHACALSLLVPLDPTLCAPLPSYFVLTLSFRVLVAFSLLHRT